MVALDLFSSPFNAEAQATFSISCSRSQSPTSQTQPPRPSFGISTASSTPSRPSIGHEVRSYRDPSHLLLERQRYTAIPATYDSTDHQIPNVKLETKDPTLSAFPTCQPPSLGMAPRRLPPRSQDLAPRYQNAGSLSSRYQHFT